MTRLPLANTSPHRRAVHTSRARQKPANRTPEVDHHDDRLGTAGRGAMETHGPNRARSLPPIPSIGESAEPTAQGSLPWMEGRGSRKRGIRVAPFPDSQRTQREGTEARPSSRRRPDDRRRARVHLASFGTAFGNREGFKRHCGLTEAQPSEGAVLRLRPGLFYFFC